MITLSRRTLCGLLPVAAGSLAMGTFPAQAADLKMVYFNAFPPVSFENAAHEITGILPDMMSDLLGKRLNMPVAMQGMPWARAQASVQDGSADGFCTLATPARRDYALFTTRAVVTFKTRLFYAAANARRNDIEAIRTIDQLKGFAQGDYVGNGFAETTFKGMPIEWTPTLESVFKKIDAGRLDVFVGTDAVGMGVARQLGLNDKILSIPVEIGAPQPFNVGFRKSLPDVATLVARVDDAIGAAEKDGTLARIMQRYTG